MKQLSGLLIVLLLVIGLFLSVSCVGTVPNLPDNSEDNSVSKENGNGENNDENHSNIKDEVEPEVPALTRPSFDINSVGAFSGNAYVELNNNVPYFTKEQITSTSYEHYTEPDSFGRCQLAVACLGKDLMPTTNRGSLSVSPSGWHGNAIYERAHLIAFSLAGEENNERNLITGTYDLNGEMQAFENIILHYIKETDNHVMYRVEPIFEGNNLVCTGVIMEALSVEDDGEGVCFNVFLYNVQDDVEIDYATGDYTVPNQNYTFIVNKSNWKIHKADCNSVFDMKEANKLGFDMTYDELIAYLKSEGKNYSNCGSCKPQNG